MKKEFKKLLKYMIVSILIVCFITNSAITITEYINSKISMKYLYTNDCVNEEYKMYLEDIEMYIGKVEDDIENTTGVTKDNYPITGAAVEMLTVLDGVYQLEMLILSVIIGIIIGIVYYIMNKDYKKIIHYIGLFIAVFLTLNMLIAIWLMVTDNIGLTTFYVTGISFAEFMDLVVITIIPYTLIYLIGSLTIYLINKKRIEKLNQHIK